jgi:dinuclear metal center YbgI/SA1388 family protein
MKIKDIEHKIAELAPNKLAMHWDNVGLQLGERNWDVKKILCTLDVTKGAIKKAEEIGADLIFSHHPFIFRPIKNLTNPLHIKLIMNKIGVFSAHTNLDVVPNGVNEALANRLQLKKLKLIDQDTGSDWYKIIVTAPKDNERDILDAVFEAGAGQIGNYSNCANKQNVVGQFIPNEKANPTIGQENKEELVDEIKIEFKSDSFCLGKVLSAMKQAHSYEEPSYDLIKLENKNPRYGLGLIGQLEEPMSLAMFTQFVKEQLQAPFVKLWSGEKANPQIKKVAICGGSGSSQLSKVERKADVFVSGDFTYHTIIDSKIPLIDAGHFYTEQPVFDFIIPFFKALDLDVELYTEKEHEINNLTII